MNERKLAFKQKDTQEELRREDKELRGKIRKAKDTHKKHLEEVFKANNSRKIWSVMKNMAGMPSKQHKPFITTDELASAVELNSFFTRFEVSETEESCTDILKSVIVHPDDRVQISVEQVAQVFWHLNAQKSTGPDNITAYVLKTYSEELAPVWQPIFHSVIGHPHCPHCLENLTCDPASKENMPRSAMISDLLLCLPYWWSHWKESFAPCSPGQCRANWTNINLPISAAATPKMPSLHLHTMS